MMFSQLVVKHVVDSSLRHGQPLDSESLPLHQLLVVLDLVFRHGLKTRKSILLGRRDVWDLVQTVERCDRASEEIVNTVRNLSSITTPQGRVRAWLRLAIMRVYSLFLILSAHCWRNREVHFSLTYYVLRSFPSHQGPQA